MLIVNAASKPGEFFEIPISGLCENTTYEFSSWLINLLPSYYNICPRNAPRNVPINVKFEIWDSTDTILLKSGDTGSIHGSNRPNWQQYGLVFQTKPGQKSVILKMRNNGAGGCGNDLAIDDIMFRTCGDAVTVEDSLNKINASVYENELPYQTTLESTPDFSVFSSHFYQWQESKDGINWVDIPGENNRKFLMKGVTSIMYYRVLIAEDAINLSNSSCNIASEVYKVNLLIGENPKKPPRKRILSVKTIEKPIKGVNVGLDLLVKPLTKKVKIIDSDKLPKTRKRVIIVKDGFRVIYKEVWIDGAVGKYVKTGEEIIKKGDVYGDIIVEEITYNKARYGYNSVDRTYCIKTNKNNIVYYE